MCHSRYLTVQSECQYFFQGLQVLLPTLVIGQPPMTAEKCDVLHLHLPVIIVSSKGRSLADLYETVQTFRSRGYQHIALLGTRGEATFLSECGCAPEVIFESHNTAAKMAELIMAWIQGEAEILRPKKLTAIERQVILHSLRSRPARSFKGVALKTFYTHRMNALRKLGLKKLTDLMINSVTGEPTYAGRYQRYFIERT